MHATPEKNHSSFELLDTSRLSRTHFKIWALSAAGVMLDGFDLFIIGICMPFLIRYFDASPWQAGAIGSAAILGAVVGASLLGHLTDRYGRKALFLLNMMVLTAFSVLCGFAWNIWALIVFRFFIGLGVGADYPICAAYVSEFMPKNVRGTMLISSFALQAIGMMLAAAVGLLVIWVYPKEDAWRWMFTLGAVPATIVLFFRTSVPESVRWLLEHGRKEKARGILRKMFPHKREIEEFKELQHEVKQDEKAKPAGYGALFSPQYLRGTILASAPWFLMDISTYGVGLFTPTILAALAFSKASGNYIAHDFYATEGALFIDIFLLAGFMLNIWLVEKVGRIRLQMIGLFGMAAGLCVLAYATMMPDGNHIVVVFAGFILFNLLMNMGPNATTFTLAAELFPTRLRATGHGFAAAVAKVGAMVGIFFLPIMKAHIGLTATLLALAGASLVGVLVTAAFRIETRGRSLEEIA